MRSTITIPVNASTGPDPALVAALASLEESFPGQIIVADALVVTAMTPRAREAILAAIAEPSLEG